MASIDIRALQKTFSNGHTALADVSFFVPDGQFVCVVGRSGAGKSTLMRCLNGSLPVSSGDAVIGGCNVASLDASGRRHLQRSVGFIYQEFNLVGRLSALQNVLTGLMGHMPVWRSVAGLFSIAERRAGLDRLQQVGMLHKAMQRTDSLSGGEKQRVAIARALAQRPDVLLADEPVANLDPELADEVLVTLRNAAKQDGVTTLVNIHNITQARRYADRIIGIANGRVVFDGAPAELDQAAMAGIYRYDRQPATQEFDLNDVLDPSVLADLDRALQAGERRNAMQGDQV